MTIPAGVTTIGAYAFRGCSHVTELVIPEGVTTIGSYAFSDWGSMKSLTIPSTVTEIGDQAFSYWSDLETVAVGMKTPVALESRTFERAFGSVATLTLYVPKGSKAAYEAADIWKDFGSIVEYDAAGIGAVSGDKSNVRWYTLDGHKLQGKPTTRGIYVTNGQKVVMQ